MSTTSSLREQDEKDATRAEQLERQREWLAPLEKRLGVPEGYILALVSEADDWAFIVKLAVLVEAAVTHAIVAHLKNDLLYDHISGIENSRRLQLALTLGILTKDDMLTLDTLAATRNSFAHRVENLGGSLDAYFSALPGDKWATALNQLFSLEGKHKYKGSDKAPWHDGTFRYVLFRMSVLPLLTLSLQHSARQLEEERAQWLAANGGSGLNALRNLGLDQPADAQYNALSGGLLADPMLAKQEPAK